MMNKKGLSIGQKKRGISFFHTRYKKLGSSSNNTVHQSVLDYALEQELMADSQVEM
jgi:hypothetical protein